MKKIEIVPLSRMEEMRKYFNEYLIELSRFDESIKFDEKGVPIYKWYEYYWNDNNRFPMFLIINDLVAGLAMIRKLEDELYEIAEFYVLPEYRKSGNAMWFANEIISTFNSDFVFSACLRNHIAIKFWTKFAKLFKASSYYDNENTRNWKIIKCKTFSL